MSNSFNISFKQDIAANLVQILLNKSSLSGIRGADLNSILTNIGVNTSAIGVCAGILDDILEDTAALPQNVRGKFYSLRLATGEIGFQDVVNFSGHGKINKIVFNSIDAATTIFIKIILDGTSFATFSHIGDTNDHILILWESPAVADIFLTSIPFTNADNNLFNLEFNSSLLVQISSGQEGASNIVQCRVNYTLDAF